MFSVSFAASATSVEGTCTVRGPELVVQSGGQSQRRLPVTGHELRNRGRIELRVARILALGRVGEEDVAADHQAGRFDQWPNDLARRAGPRGRFEDQEMIPPEMRGEAANRTLDEGKVRLPVWAERRWHADQDRIGLDSAPEVCCGLKLAR